MSDERIYIILAHLNQFKAKMKDIEIVIEDFDYSTKKIYKDDIAMIENHINNEIKEIENDLKNITNKQTIDRIDNLIDEINRTYKNAYNKKNNVSSLSYIMEIEEDINLIKKIDANDFK